NVDAGEVDVRPPRALTTQQRSSTVTVDDGAGGPRLPALGPRFQSRCFERVQIGGAQPAVLAVVERGGVARRCASALAQPPLQAVTVVGFTLNNKSPDPSGSLRRSCLRRSGASSCPRSAP